MNTVPLSPIDHVFTGVGSYPIEFVFSYDRLIDPDRLKESLDKTLTYFYPLSSKLEKISDNSFGFVPTPDGLTYVVDLSEKLYDESEDHSEFIDSVNTYEGEVLTKIKLTQTPAGSVLGVSISHALVDGFSFFQFLSSWSRVFRGKRILEPVHDRFLLIPEISDTGETISSGEFLEKSGLFWERRRQSYSKDQYREERITFSKEMLQNLFAEAGTASDVRLSYNDIVVAYLWKKCISEWNRDSEGTPVYISCPSDFRRMLPGFSRVYFGCAVCLATGSIDYERLISASLGELAGIVRTTINEAKEPYIRGVLEILERLRRQRGIGAMEEIHVMHPTAGFLVTNLSRMPVNDLDFGTGPPVALKPLTSVRRGAVVLPATDGLDVRLFHLLGSD